MKTQIITLESYDDLISVRDRMSWAKSPRILLVWPKFEKVSLRPIDLRILQKHASNLGAELGLITRRAEVRRDAEGFKIPVFTSTVAAQRNAWSAQRSPTIPRLRATDMLLPELRSLAEDSMIKEEGWRSNPVTRVGFFAAGVIAVFAIVSLFIPSAVIRLMPITKKQETSLQVTADTTITSVQIIGSIPAYAMSVIAEGSQTEQVTSRLSIPQDKAHGFARFTNLTQSDLMIPAGTTVFSIGPNTKRFVTVNNTHIIGPVNSTVEVPIEAVEAGASGNLPANSIQVIDGRIGLSSSVTNPVATSGGSDRLVIAPSADDRTRVRQALLERLASQAQKSIVNSIGPKDLLLKDTLKSGRILEESYDPPAGQTGSLLNLRMRVEFGSQYVKADELSQLSQASMDPSIPEGFVLIPGTFQFHLADTPLLDESGASHFNLLAEQILRRQVDVRQANSVVRGQWPNAAARILKSRFSLAESPIISTKPSWWPWLPLIPFRISFIIE